VVNSAGMRDRAHTSQIAGTAPNQITKKVPITGDSSAREVVARAYYRELPGYVTQFPGLSRRSHSILGSDVGAMYESLRMDQGTLIRAAQITLRRAICERFPPGSQRQAWLAWAERPLLRCREGRL